MHTTLAHYYPGHGTPPIQVNWVASQLKINIVGSRLFTSLLRSL